MEGLLAHFFSPDRPDYAREDVSWFLKLANDQKQWCSNLFLSEEDSVEALSTTMVVCEIVEEQRSPKNEVNVSVKFISWKVI